MIRPCSCDAPTVSILIPCFNAERWIGGAVESALAQQSAALSAEVIVVDDGSSDGSLDVIQGFGDRVRWESSPNRGGGHARNQLLALSTAAWVQYLDADDRLEPGKIVAQLALAGDAPEPDVLYSPVTVEHYVADALVRRETDPIAASIDDDPDPWRMLALWRLPQTGGALWRRSALEAVGGWKEDQPCCQEHELYLRLLAAGATFSFTPALGAICRRFDGGTVSTRDAAKVRRERAKIEDRLEAHLASAGMLTPERQHAINQARFDMARSAWTEDKAEARRHCRAIRRSGARFTPGGPAAPSAYRRIYGWLGFEAAERVAEFKRLVLDPRQA